MSKIKIIPVVHSKIKGDLCPKCGAELDTGYECNNCGFDALPFVQADTSAKP